MSVVGFAFAFHAKQPSLSSATSRTHADLESARLHHFSARLDRRLHPQYSGHARGRRARGAAPESAKMPHGVAVS